MNRKTRDYIIKVVMFQALVFGFWITFFLLKDYLFR